ncbi:hypothetical protein CBM2599_B50301 [Cupriavidus taiwanensis]|nr:hypothetical protein CBM2599_B50301 [Cupriavidus taiwanensis]
MCLRWLRRKAICSPSGESKAILVITLKLYGKVRERRRNEYRVPCQALKEISVVERDVVSLREKQFNGIENARLSTVTGTNETVQPWAGVPSQSFDSSEVLYPYCFDTHLQGLLKV